jgi:hypothetical protein
VRDSEVLVSALRGSAERWGNLGNGFLKQFVVTLDYRARRMELHAEGGAGR